MAETGPGACAIDHRGLMQFGADCLKSGQQADRVERHTAPHIDDDHRHHGHDEVAKPDDPRADDAGVEQRPVKDSITSGVAIWMASGILSADCFGLPRLSEYPL
jgi:hypothetical protein